MCTSYSSYVNILLEMSPRLCTTLWCKKTRKYGEKLHKTKTDVFLFAMMYPQELIDEIVDYLHDWPSALKACSLASRKFYPRTRVHLFRHVNCDNCDDPKSAPIFDIARDSPELLQCVKHVELRCLDFFLPEHQTATADFLHSLTFPVTLSVWDDSNMACYSEEECEWRHILPGFVSTAPYGAVARLELNNPQWNTFLEFHGIVLSLPNVTELYISDLREMNTINDAFVPVSLAPRIKKMHVDVDWDTVLIFWEGLRSYRSVYLDHLEDSHVINCSLEELSSVVQTANLAPKDLKVLEIDCHQRKCPSCFIFRSCSPVTPNSLAPHRRRGSASVALLSSLEYHR